MFNPAIPRGANARESVLLAFASAFALAALFAAINSVYAAERCVMVDFDRLQSEMTAGHAVWLTDGQTQFARGLFLAATPPGHFRLPSGDKAFEVFGVGEDGADIVKFVDGAVSCGYLSLDPGFRAPMADIKSGVVAHAGEGL